MADLTFCSRQIRRPRCPSGSVAQGCPFAQDGRIDQDRPLNACRHRERHGCMQSDSPRCSGFLVRPEAVELFPLRLALVVRQPGAHLRKHNEPATTLSVRPIGRRSVTQLPKNSVQPWANAVRGRHFSPLWRRRCEHFKLRHVLILPPDRPARKARNALRSRVRTGNVELRYLELYPLNVANP